MKIVWADFKFPPINLWVMPRMYTLKIEIPDDVVAEKGLDAFEDLAADIADEAETTVHLMKGDEILSSFYNIRARNG